MWGKINNTGCIVQVKYSNLISRIIKMGKQKVQNDYPWLYNFFAAFDNVCILHIKHCHMRIFTMLLFTILSCAATHAQLLTWSPQFPEENSALVITVDATKGNQGLFNYADPNNIYVHCGVTTNLSGNGGTEWKYVNGATGGTYGSVTPTLKAVSLGNNKYQYTIANIRTFFGVPNGETIKTVNILFRDANANASLVKKQANSDGSDMFIPVYAAGQNHIQFTQPYLLPTFNTSHEKITAAVGQVVPLTALASTTTGTLNLYFNGNKIAGPVTGTNLINGNASITATGNQQVVAELISGGKSFYDTINFYITPVSVVAPLPAGVKEGINYGPNCSSVTLVLFAPNKLNVVAIGDFPGSNWSAQSQYQMNRTPDSNYYWITINGLTSGTEYAFQYLVDNSIYIADPYSEKILDPNNDQYIPTATYPNLKIYPVNANVSASQNGIVGVLQPCAPAYNWQVNNFVKPDKRNLITYELLVRDFGDARNYQMLIDTIGYFKRLGINAIELMPVNEFTGNESWGYNPTFYCALDKAYGTKNKMKEFVDLCHKNGIAVILDVVYNHMDAYSNPQGKLYWDAAAGKPAANSPWFNRDAPHPYSVFQDLNHTSAATQYLVERSMEYWLTEYKADGFRLDLAKGFTQTQSNETTVENYDASRVANLNRYFDYIVPKFPGTYMILEFLATQRKEEQEYAAKGFMLWGNNNPTYNQNTMGYNTNADFSKVVYNSAQEAFTTPSEMGYMESHDEERLMYKNLQFGNSANSYNVKNIATALERQAAAAALFFTVPGPKMVWQFGERGYDISINDGGSNVANKPPHWEYMADSNRLKLWNTYSKLIRLRLANPGVFNNTSFNYDFNDSNRLFRRFQIADTASNGIKITVVANMDVTAQARSVVFQSGGNWYNYAANGRGAGLNGAADTFTISNATQIVTLQPGEYHVYVSVPACSAVSPVVNTPVTFCQNATTTALTANGSNLLWYTTATGGTGTAAAPLPSSATTGSTTYYVSQTNTCESPRAAIVVNVVASTPAPTVSSPINYCQNVAATPLAATGTSLLWYTTATGGTGSSAAPTPVTTALGSTSYYVSQTLSCGESPRATLIVNINGAPAAPQVTTPVSYCQNVTANALAATGTNLLWYSAASGGTSAATAPVPVTTVAGSSSYYVSQTNTCSESPRAAIVVNITPTPAAPAGLAVSNITFTSAFISWAPLAGLYYTLEYKPSTSVTWQIALTNTTATGSFTLQGLLPATNYDLRITANCAAAPATNYSTARFITSLRSSTITNIRNGIGLKISPNPVAGSAVIDYVVPGYGNVHLILYGPQGQQLQQLLKTGQVRGQYQLNVSTAFNNLPAGNYFLVLSQNEKSNYIHFIKK